ncbi:MAG: 3-deoxy-7-phosphoheptulonate synthase [Treponema sp.]|jgi:3-deoxy-7-phosphoheptulonate synthase|nr:3-deoxy-7-phosphoheptulonate synthase [Treponema sp.]
MIVILSKGAGAHDKGMICSFLQERGFTIREQLLGDDALISAAGKGGSADDLRELALLPGVERVASTSRPYELASRETKAEDTIAAVGPVKIGGARISIIAGPCAVESREQIMETAQRVREAGAVILRGGAFKPRTSPYAFQGLGMRGLEYLKAAGEAQGMPVVTEVVSPELALQMRDLTDMFQIGARNMQNFELLKKAGALGKPVLLKRGPSATIEEWLLSAEYLLASGCRDVALCERGIRTFETYTRNTLDISAIAVIKRLSHLPVIVDPSHAVGIRAMVPSAGLSAIAAGADGLTVEVHPHPDKALSDGPQSLYPSQFERLMRDIGALAPVVGKELFRAPRPYLQDGGGRPGKPCQSGQRPSELPVAYSGQPGAYAEQALLRAFGEEVRRASYPSFAAVFDAVLDGSAGFGVVPVENSLTGSIHENYDLFVRYPDISMAGELKLRIVHCLIGAAGAAEDTIQVVRSHPQGFTQCQDFLDRYPWKREIYYNTAAAVASLLEEDESRKAHTAAIAGEAAALTHGLNIIKFGIEKDPFNYTRFVIIARKNGEGRAPVPPSLGSRRPDKASLVFSVPDTPGALYACLQIMNDRGINLSKLESRPIQGRPWEYLFYVDINYPQTDEDFTAALEALKPKTESFYFLGAYRGAQ